MPTLSDRQRVELAIPAYLLYALTAAPGVFVPADPDLAARAEADITALRADLQAALLEPFSDLVPKKQHALLRRVERIGKGVITGWGNRPALSVMLTLWYFLKDLTDREVLILWEGSAMERATSRLLPMFAHGFDEQKRDAAAQEQARQLLACLRAEGLYN
ncbi:MULTISPECIES: hypothetical protein [Methylobacterium]|jgi:hypothetical protein|uniref:Uncharacterized protein n=2 Tax=Methylobacterium TaxID=407 RepID=A0A2R4WUK6_9HYPH|nr:MULTISPECIES: hypothetical protein [Methylobacterium]AWB25227.1 hypothetical protein DA075_30285 [Methylobacterium currus]TGD95205.1 hypothetical protein EU555_29285 [Methylobacterium nonmethylotrophicum]SFF72013.1 hypothetical protein SAMN04487844_1428 [Methylobacterium sp. yr596]